jgi:hypothetical protein
VLIRSVRRADIPEILEFRKASILGITVPKATREAEYRDYLIEHGKGWLCIQNDQIVAFGAVDIEASNLWALMVNSLSQEYECGNKLHEILLDWYFAVKSDPLWLSADSGSGEEAFYLTRGWHRTGIMANGEMRFEMTQEIWKKIRFESVDK